MSAEKENLPSGPGRLRRIIRAATRFVRRLVVATVLCIVSIWILLQIPPVSSFVARSLLNLANPWPGTKATVGSAGGSWFASLSLTDIVVTSPADSLLISIDTLEASYNLPALLGGTLYLEKVFLSRPIVRSRYLPDGSTVFLHPFAPSEEGPEDTSGDLRIRVDQLEVVNGEFALLSHPDTVLRRLELLRIDATADSILIAGGVRAVLDSVSCKIKLDASESNELQFSAAGSLAQQHIRVRSFALTSARTSITGEGYAPLPFSLPQSLPQSQIRIAASRVSYGDLHHLMPEFGPEGEARLKLASKGMGDSSLTDLNLEFPDGGTVVVQGKAISSSGAAMELNIAGSCEQFSPSSVTGLSDTTVSLHATFSVDGIGSSLKDFTGRVGLRLLPSEIGMNGPVTGFVDATARNGRVHALLGAELRPVQVTATADLMPFEKDSAFEMHGVLKILHSDSTESPWYRLGGLAAKLQLSGQGMGPHSGSAHAVVTGAWTGNPYFSSLQIKGAYSDDTALVGGHLITSSGSAHFTAEAIFGESTQYRLHIPAFRNICLADIGANFPSTDLTGTLRAEARGTSLDKLTGTLSLILDPSRVANVPVHSLVTEISMDSGLVRFTGNGQSDAGFITLQGVSRPSQQSPYLVLEQLKFRKVDLGKILQKDGMTSDLNGSLEVHATAQSLNAVSRLFTGRLPGGKHALQAAGNLRLDQSRVNRDTIRAATFAVRLDDSSLDASAEVKTRSGAITGQGTARPFERIPLFTIPGLRFEHLDIAALTGTSNLPTDLTGVLQGEYRGEALERATGKLSADFTNTTDNSIMPIGASLRAEMEEGQFSVKSSAEFEDGRVIIAGDGQFTPGGVQGRVLVDAATTDTTIVVAGADIGAHGLQIRSVLEGSWGAAAETDLRGTVKGGGSGSGFVADTLLCDFSICGRVIKVDTLNIHTNVAIVAGGGTLALFDPASTDHTAFSLSAHVMALQPLEKFLGIGPTFLRSADFSLHASGPPGMTDLHCVTDVDMVALGSEIALTSLQGTVNARLGPSLTLGSMDASIAITGLESGPIALDSATIMLHSVRNKHDITGVLGFNRGLTIGVGGSVQDEKDSATVLVDSLVYRSPSAVWSLDKQASITIGPRLVVRDFALHSGVRDIIVNGVLDPRREHDFTVTADSLNVENLGSLLGRPALGGLIFTNVHIGGPAGNPRAVGEITIALRGAEKELGLMTTHLDWGARELALDGHIQEPSGGTLDATARLPVPLPLRTTVPEALLESSKKATVDSLSILLTADRFNIDFFRPLLSPKALSALAGMLSANIRISGFLDSVAVEGSASIDNGQVGIASLGTVFEGIQLQCAAEGQKLKIEDMTALSGGGALRLTGVISLQNSARPALDAKVSLDKFVAIQTADMKGNLSGDILLKGNALAPEVTGSLVIDDSYFVLPETGKLDSVEYVELTPADYAMLQKYFGYRRQVGVVKETPSVVEPTIDLTLTMQNNTWVRKRRNPILAIELEGSVRIERRPGKPPRLTGMIRCPPGRSYVGQFGRQFELTQGEILLKGPLDETELHIDTEYKVPSKGGTGLSEVVIRMKVENNLGRFIFSLTSDPAMDESDIFSYLATGQSRTGALANTGDQGGLAGAMALEQLVGVAGGFAEGSMPLDVFQIRQDGARGITVVAGNYVSSKTYMGIRQPVLFSQGTQDTYYDTRTQYELEYEAQPWLFLNLQGGSSRTLLFLKARVAY